MTGDGVAFDLVALIDLLFGRIFLQVLLEPKCQELLLQNFKVQVVVVHFDRLPFDLADHPLAKEQKEEEVAVIVLLNDVRIAVQHPFLAAFEHTFAVYKLGVHLLINGLLEFWFDSIHDQHLQHFAQGEQNLLLLFLSKPGGKLTLCHPDGALHHVNRLDSLLDFVDVVENVVFLVIGIALHELQLVVDHIKLKKVLKEGLHASVHAEWHKELERVVPFSRRHLQHFF